jgi:dCMP deaminase
MTRMSWDKYGLEIAKAASCRSEDPYLKVGACVLRRDRSIISIGYNGAAPGVDIPWEDRDARRGFVIHAEVNALRYCTPDQTTGGYLYVTHHPCSECIKVIASYGITNVMYSDLIDVAVYDLSSIAELAKAFNIILKQEVKQ